VVGKQEFYIEPALERQFENPITPFLPHLLSPSHLDLGRSASLHSAIFKVNWKPARAASTGYYSGRRSNRRLYSSSDQPCYLEWRAQLFQKCDVASKLAVQERYNQKMRLSVSSCSLQSVAERPLPCNYNVIQFVCALSRRSHAADHDRHCACGLLAEQNTRRTKLTGSFTGSWPCLR
jgi:hypothetical protein